MKNYQIAKESYNLPFEVLTADSQITNETKQDKVYVFTNKKLIKQKIPNILSFLDNFDFKSNIILGIVGPAEPSSGYHFKLFKLSKQKSTVRIEYQLLRPPADSVQLTTLTYPNLFLSVERKQLPAGKIHFHFYNRSTHQKHVEVIAV